MEKSVENLETQQPEMLMPSGTSIIGFQYAGCWAVDSVFYTSPLPRYYTVGQQTYSYHLTITEKTTGIIGLALYPTTLWHWFKKPVVPFTNHPTDSRSVFGEQLAPTLKKIEAAASHEESTDYILDFFTEFVRNKLRQPTMADHALELIFEHKGCISTAHICKSLHISERHLQHLFRNQVGVSPAKYARIIRFNNIFCELAKSAHDRNVSFLTSFYNYYDASHFNKDFKAYCGFSPTAFHLEQFHLLEQLLIDQPYLIQVQKK